MIRKLNALDKERTLAYLEEHPSFSLFFIADMEKFGFDGNIFSIWACFDESGAIRYVFGKYYETLMAYTNTDTIDVAQIDRYLIDNGITFNLLVTRSTLFAQFNKIWPFRIIRTNYLCELVAPGFCPQQNSVQTEMALASDAAEIAALSNSMEEFEGLSITEEAIRLNIQDEGVIVVRKDGRIESSAMCTARTSVSASIGGVCTAKGFRGRGYASRVVSDLSQKVLSKGLTCILMYDNPEAGSIYLRLGYKPVGTVNIAIK